MLNRVLRRLRGSYWPLPSACLVLAIVLAVVMNQVDRGLDRAGHVFTFTGGPDSARTLLSTIAASMLSLAGLVFSITIVVLQLTSSQYSPRALRTFLRDRLSQLALGAFLGTFVYALWALREVRGQDGLVDRFVPGVTITVAFVLVLVSVGLFVHHIHHVASSIRAVSIIERVAVETRATIERVHRDEADAGGDATPQLHRADGARPLTARRPGIVAAIDVDRLVTRARRSGAQVAVLAGVGDFVPLGAPVMSVHGGDGSDDDDLMAAVDLATERDARQDVAFGLRQLVDIAERALSPGVNDPSTAVTCIDQLHDLLRRLAVRPYPPAVLCDEEGVARLQLVRQTWDGHVALAFDEIRLWGGGSLQVRERLGVVLADLLDTAPAARRAPLRARQPLWRQPLDPAG